MKVELAAIGELLVDFAPSGRNADGLELYAASPGGAPANVCTMYAKLGGSALFIGKVGEDSFGLLLKDTLRRYNVATEGLLVDQEHKTSLAFVTLAPDGERSFSFYRKNSADSMLRTEEIKDDWLHAHYLHFGSVSLTSEPARSATLDAVERARSFGAMISYDPNYRPMLWQNPSVALGEMRRAAALADLIKVSEEELACLTGTADLSEGAGRLLAGGASLVLVTLGERGVYYHSRRTENTVAGFQVDTVDTTGAGDTFMGAFLYCIRDSSLQELRRMTRRELDQRMRMCNAAAAISTTSFGAMSSMPDLGRVEAFLAQQSHVQPDSRTPDSFHYYPL